MAAPRDFGWWIESTDEEIYGPVTKETLASFLQDGIISANTPIRHCTDAVAAPVVDQGIVEGIDFSSVKRTGDTLSESWPRRKRERLALAESDVECAYHRRPAVLTCIRCLAPYCAKCQLNKKRGVTYYMCKKCQASKFNRRIMAFFVDGFLINGVPTWATMFGMVAFAGTAAMEGTGAMVVNLVSLGSNVIFVVRDTMLEGAGPGKRMFGLRVVKHEDGVSPPSYGQSFIRWLGHLVPIFNLIDASRAYSDPLQRRFGDSWAKTRVLEAPHKVEKARAKVQARLARKGIEYHTADVMSLEDFARTDG